MIDELFQGCDALERRVIEVAEAVAAVCNSHSEAIAEMTGRSREQTIPFVIGYMAAVLNVRANEKTVEAFDQGVEVGRAVLAKACKRFAEAPKPN